MQITLFLIMYLILFGNISYNWAEVIERDIIGATYSDIDYALHETLFFNKR